MASFAEQFQALRKSRGTSGVKSYEDEVGGSYKAGHPQQIARPKTPAGKQLQKLASSMAADPLARMGGKSKMGAAARLMARQKK